MLTALAIVLGFILDLIIGDPRWLPHPVVGMGKTITWAEPHLRTTFNDDYDGERSAGLVLAMALPFAAWFLASTCLDIAGMLSPWARFVLETFMCYQIFATCELRRQSMAVLRALRDGTLEDARKAVGMIVGRDVSALDRDGVTRAAVETVAENLSDGVVSPLLFMTIGGAPLGMLFKAVSTLDSMIGYKNERYREFGSAAARFDDALNWVPARLSALCVIAASAVTGGDARGAWRIWRRDRRKHESPNAGQPEAAMAGALGVQLNGPAVYFGEVVDKPVLGDPVRPIEPEDIRRANRIMIVAVVLALVVLVGLRVGYMLVR